MDNAKISFLNIFVQRVKLGFEFVCDLNSPCPQSNMSSTPYSVKAVTCSKSAIARSVTSFMRLFERPSPGRFIRTRKGKPRRPNRSARFSKTSPSTVRVLRVPGDHHRPHRGTARSEVERCGLDRAQDPHREVARPRRHRAARRRGTVEMRHIPAVLFRILAAHRRISRFSEPSDFVFCQSTGTPCDPGLVRRSVLYPAVDSRRHRAGSAQQRLPRVSPRGKFDHQRADGGLKTLAGAAGTQAAVDDSQHLYKHKSPSRGARGGGAGRSDFGHQMTTKRLVVSTNQVFKIDAL